LRKTVSPSTRRVLIQLIDESIREGALGGLLNGSPELLWRAFGRLRTTTRASKTFAVKELGLVCSSLVHKFDERIELGCFSRILPFCLP